MKILIVEDNQSMARAVAKMFEKENIVADIMFDGTTGYMQALKAIYDVIVLDIMLPGMDGLTMMRKLREQGINTPVILLTAKDSLSDKLTGFESGADDYLVKPFSTKELIMRVKALSRRNTEILPVNVIEHADVRLDVNSGTLCVAGKESALTAKETLLMELLMKNLGKVLSKDFILDRVWGVDSYAIDNSVEIYIHYLRKKLGEKSRLSIVTIRGLGYSLREKTDA